MISVWEMEDTSRLRQSIVERAASAARARLTELGIMRVKIDVEKAVFSGSVSAHFFPLPEPDDMVEVQPPPLLMPSWKKIAREVCAKHRISMNELVSHRRDQMFVRARYEFFYRCRQETSMSLPQIGRRCGGRDHTTVIHGLKKYEQRMREAANA